MLQDFRVRAGRRAHLQRHRLRDLGNIQLLCAHGHHNAVVALLDPCLHVPAHQHGHQSLHGGVVFPAFLHRNDIAVGLRRHGFRVLCREHLIPNARAGGVVAVDDGEIQVRQTGGQVCRLHRLDGDIVRIFNDVLFGCLQAHALLQRKDAQVLQQEQGAAAVGGVRRDADLIAGAAGAGRQAQRQYQRQYQCQKFFHNKLPSLNCFSNISQTAANGVFAEAGGALFSACACPLCGRQDQK